MHHLENDALERGRSFQPDFWCGYVSSSCFGVVPYQSYVWDWFKIQGRENKKTNNDNDIWATD